MKADFYETLGVAKGRRREGAQERLPQARHAVPSGPNPGDHACEHKFKEINEAYETLKDPQKRAAYDRFGHAAFEQGGMNGGGAGLWRRRFLRHFRGYLRRDDGRRASAARPAAASAAPICATTWKSRWRKPLPARPRRSACRPRSPARTAPARGAKPGTQPMTCATCQGSGRVRAAQGFFSIERTCPHCQGRGQTINDPCTKCHGQGRVTEERSLSVNIPAGIEDGTRIRLPARARPACAAARRAISTSSCRSSRTNSSSATAPTSTARCRSR